MSAEQYTRPALSPLGMVGAALFALWGVLHLWVGFEGLHQYLNSVEGQWRMLIGGSAAPFDQFMYPTDTVTMHAQSNIVLIFCFDIAGYGVLGIFVTWLLVRQATWMAYFMGVALIGICDLSFTFLQVTAGIIQLNIPTISGPVLWLAAAIITPFGLPPLSRSKASL